MYHIDLTLSTNSLAIRTYLRHINLYCATAVYKERKDGNTYRITLEGVEWDYFYNYLESKIYDYIPFTERVIYDTKVDAILDKIQADKERKDREVAEAAYRKRVHELIHQNIGLQLAAGGR